MAEAAQIPAAKMKIKFRNGLFIALERITLPSPSPCPLPWGEGETLSRFFETCMLVDSIQRWEFIIDGRRAVRAAASLLSLIIQLDAIVAERGAQEWSEVARSADG